jgi:hypothetical protein
MNMRRNKRDAPHLAIVMFISACLFVSVASGLRRTQGDERITKENLIAALQNCKSRRHCTRCQQCELKASDFIRQIKELKVSFILSECDEGEIRKAGDFLGKKGLDELIVTIREEYLTYVITPGGSRLVFSIETIPQIGKFTLLDAYGDDAVEGKIRLIHASINSTLRLDTNYRFYDGGNDALNIFSVPRLDKNYPDGTLLIGREIIKRNLTTDTSGAQLAGDAILYLLIAHEMSHLKQAKVGCFPGDFKRRDLHADFLAGWWVARFLKTTRSDSSEYKDAFFKVVGLAFDSGDRGNSGYQGTPKERLDAVNAGFGLQNETDPDKVYRKGIEYVAHF